MPSDRAEELLHSTLQHWQQKSWFQQRFCNDGVSNLSERRQVLCFNDVLRQIWSGAGAVLRSAKHPYNYDVSGTSFNPDPCPRWVNTIITLDDAVSKDLTRLSEFYGVQITSKIQESYGILIADGWEMLTHNAGWTTMKPPMEHTQYPARFDEYGRTRR